MSGYSILIVASRDTTARRLKDWCRKRPCHTAAFSGERARDYGQFDLVLLAPALEDHSAALDLAGLIRSANPTVPIVLLPSHSSEDLAIAALRAGVTEFFKPPLRQEDVGAALERYAHDISVPPGLPSVGGILGQSLVMRELKTYLGRIALTASNVLITGETGTGKEVAAATIHSASARASRPLMVINCAAIPDTLVESELFGYERGAFTGANGAHDGKLRSADGGTVFLDEIGDMTLYAQAKILRAIDSGKVCRLGGSQEIPVDVRYIAATNRDIEELIGRGGFRSDLYFRLNIARVRLPALRERMEDVPELLWHYLQACNRRSGRRVEGFSADAQRALLMYRWPGNVRELMNVLEAAFINVRGPRISLEDLPERLNPHAHAKARANSTERDQVLSALFATDWNKSRAAQQLKWSRMTLYRKMAKHRISARKGGEGDTFAAGAGPTL